MDFDSILKGLYLLDCPNEIISSILLYCAPADRLRLSRVNKRLNEAANRLLYSTVQFKWAVENTSGEMTTPPVAIFLRSILRNSRLAALVQSLRLVGDSSFYESWRPRHDFSWAGTGSTLDQAVSLVAELPLPYAQDWVQGLEEGAVDATIAFLLARLPTLRSFLTTANFTKEMTLQGAMFQSVLCGENQVGWLPRFDQLRDVSAESYRDYRVRCEPNTNALLPFFYLPSIETLHLCLDNPVRFSWPAATAPDPTTLTSLTLRHVREWALKGILSSTKRLIKLDWEFLYSETSISPKTDSSLCPPVADLDVLVDALDSVRNTLKDLTIRGEVLQPVGLEYHTPIEVRGSLKGLVDFNVERLHVPLPFLAGRLVPNNRFRVSERIPKNIRTLVLSDDLSDFSDSMLDEEDWDHSEISLNLLDWLCEGLDSTPFIERLELGGVSGTGQGYVVYHELKRLLGKKRASIKIILGDQELEPDIV